MGRVWGCARRVDRGSSPVGRFLSFSSVHQHGRFAQLARRLFARASRAQRDCESLHPSTRPPPPSRERVVHRPSERAHPIRLHRPPLPLALLAPNAHPHPLPPRTLYYGSRLPGRARRVQLADRAARQRLGERRAGAQECAEGRAGEARAGQETDGGLDSGRRAALGETSDERCCLRKRGSEAAGEGPACESSAAARTSPPRGGGGSAPRQHARDAADALDGFQCCRERKGSPGGGTRQPVVRSTGATAAAAAAQRA